LSSAFWSPAVGLRKNTSMAQPFGRSRRVMAAFGADDEIARGALTFVIDQ
jgi:hypothetical protein